ncbi:MAG: hypothetical protein PF487_02485, partial [Bacteroidales bacterium]|nr:hypothetical protein [Bacteroidales bacterium]
MKKIFLLFISTIFAISAFCQTDSNDVNQKFVSLVSPTGGGFTFYLPDGNMYDKNKIKGSPYIFENWQAGTVFFKKNELSSDYKFNYNSYLDQVEFVKDGKHLMITNKKDVNHIQFKDKDFYYVLFLKNDNEIISGYLDKLVDGKIVLYKRYKCYLLKNSNNYTITSGDVVDKFDQDIEYYISKDDKAAFKIKNKRRK